MKCFVAVLLLALFAIVMAVEQVPEIKKVASVEKETQVDAARDKRGLVLGAYAPLSYAAPYSYSSYSLPYAYSPYPYSYYSYPYYSSPYYVV
ncbi:uncharacterized protein LOC105254510 [Camponotus floridanus]|uniref:uncharacterized protein LOC105254510 n=1 Tax=Camponotus floridanus TaxID=104421 RepID=UPI00059B66A0|nr:uncharacterized protein LOC105254510 [Camponotus floridanus]